MSKEGDFKSVDRSTLFKSMSDTKRFELLAIYLKLGNESLVVACCSPSASNDTLSSLSSLHTEIIEQIICFVRSFKLGSDER